MKIPNVGTYRCLCCGSLVDQELQRLPPFCCGIEMTKTGECSAGHDGLLIPPVIAHRWTKILGSRPTEPTPAPPTEFVARQPL